MTTQQRQRLVAGINDLVGFESDFEFGSDFLKQFPVTEPMPSPRQVYDWLTLNDVYYYNVDTEEVKSLFEFLHRQNKATTIVAQLMNTV